MLRAYKLDPRARIPTKANPGDAGSDLYSIEDVFLPIGQVTMVNTGIALEIPEGTYAQISNRSSMGKKGIAVMGGVLDAGYNGPCTVMLANLCCSLHRNGVVEKTTNTLWGHEGYWVRAGDRVAQVVYHKFENATFEETSTLWTSERGDKGFGSSGA